MAAWVFDDPAYANTPAAVQRLGALLMVSSLDALQGPALERLADMLAGGRGPDGGFGSALRPGG